MYALLSPAKTLKFDLADKDMPQTNPIFKNQTDLLTEELKKFSSYDIKRLMKVSDKLAELNAERYQTFDSQPQKQALLAFQGDVYQELNAKNLSDEDLQYASSHIGILSGLYGLLRGSDVIRPYRLEMGTSLPIEGHKNLYGFWHDHISHAINDNARQVNASHILNIASNEYAKAIDINALERPFITIDFKEIKGGKAPRTIGIYAKKARGMMARFLAQTKPISLSDVQKFNEEGYRFDPVESGESKLLFVRDHKT